MLQKTTFRAMKPRAAGKKEIGDPSLGERVGRGEVLDPGEVVCPICMCILLDPVEMPCKHTICTPCYEVIGIVLYRKKTRRDADTGV